MHQQDIRSGVPPALDHSHHHRSARHTMCVVVTSTDGCIQLQGGRQIRLKLGKAILGVSTNTQIQQCFDAYIYTNKSMTVQVSIKRCWSLCEMLPQGRPCFI